MSIGARIKQLRKMELLTQQEFAERLGIKGPYISELEKGKKNPSEQLILSICRAFRVRMEWLKDGTGEMYEKSGFLPKGFALIEAIYGRLTSPERPIPLSTVAKVLGINPKDMPHDLKLHKDFPGALHLLVEIFEAGDKKSVEAVMAQLKALKPEIKSLASNLSASKKMAQ